MRISDIIRKIADKEEEIYSQVGIVQSVNRENSTCDVLPINGDAPIWNVRFQANLEQDTGFILEPQLGSEVVVCFLDRNSAFIANSSQLEQIHCYIHPLENQNSELTFDLNSDGIYTKVEGTNSVSEIVTTESEINLTVQEKTYGEVKDSSEENSGNKLKMNLDQEQLELIVDEGTENEIYFTVKNNLLKVKLSEDSVLTFDKESGFSLKSEKTITIDADEEVKITCPTLNVNDVFKVNE